MFLELLDQDDTQLLQDVFDHLKRRLDQNSKVILNSLKLNSPILQKACRDDNYEFIKILVKNGCRLKTSKEKKDLVQDSWSRYCKSLPIGFHEEDEVKDLRILKLMAKTSYILSCYDAIIETKVDENGEINDCGCQSTFNSRHDSFVLETPIRDLGTRILIESKHFCADNKDFERELFCTVHVECNDPIFMYV